MWLTQSHTLWARAPAACSVPPMDRGVDVNLRSAPQMLEYEAIVERIVADAPASILDWGCGLGQVSTC